MADQRHPGGPPQGGPGSGRDHSQSRGRPGGRRAAGPPGRPGSRTAGPASPSARPRRVDPAREAPFELLRAVDRDDAYANLAWPRILSDYRLSGRDAGFATTLAYGTLRWRGLHDTVLAQCVDRPLSELQPELLDALTLGVHQLLLMRVGAHAAVDSTVELVAARVNPGAARLANAVLRRAAAHDSVEGWLDALAAADVLPALDQDPVGHLVIATSHPAWIVRALHEALAASEPARTWTDTRAALLADNEPAGVTLAARTLSGEALLTQVREQGMPAQLGRWSPYAVRVSAADPASVPAVATGAAGVQDEGSQVVALALAEAAIEGPDLRWLDLCAGPGGKAALLAARAAERGGKLTAVEQHPHRADLVRSALRPVRGRHEVVVADGTRLARPEGGYDRVLVDAPCTGLGALRRRPEARWRRDSQDLAALTPLQAALLEHAVALVRPGGLVLYATCSPHLAETEAVVERVVRRAPAEVVPFGEAGIKLPDASTAGPYLRLWPHVHDTDGMFAALLRRTP